ncbi:hypothetical protein CFC21_008095, partial [Triticum aestivum]
LLGGGVGGTLCSEEEGDIVSLKNYMKRIVLQGDWRRHAALEFHLHLGASSSS